MPAFQLITHFPVHECLFYNIENNLFYAFHLGILCNVILVLTEEDLKDVVGLGHLALALIALILALESAA